MQLVEQKATMQSIMKHIHGQCVRAHTTSAGSKHHTISIANL